MSSLEEDISVSGSSESESSIEALGGSNEVKKAARKLFRQEKHVAKRKMKETILASLKSKAEKDVQREKWKTQREARKEKRTAKLCSERKEKRAAGHAAK